MTIKSILCIFGGSSDELSILDSTFSLAKKHDAHACFLHISSDPTEYAFGYREDAISMAPVLETIKKESQRRMKRAQKYVVSYAEKYRVPVDMNEPPLNQASVQFKHQTDSVNEAIAREGRLSDLIIMSHEQARSDGLYEQKSISALFNTGRPVMFLPEKWPVPVQLSGNIISLAWNGSLESTRALQHSMSFMTKAKKVHILTAPENGEDESLRDMLVTYLGRQGIRADIDIIDRGGHHNIEEAILAKVKELHSDLFVMGAYGHSRFREIILGGMTEYMLKNADVPLLLSH